MDKNKYETYKKILKETSYSKQDHWDIYKELFFKKLSDFESLNSFRINGLSNMLETGLPSEDLEKALRGNNYSQEYNSFEKKDIEKRFSQLAKMMGDDILKIPFNSLIGNPRHHKLIYEDKNYFLNFDDLYHVYSSWQLKRMLNHFNQSPKIILEIGGGYGNLAFKLKNIFKNSKYIIIDLPEVLLIQNYFLHKSDPRLKILNLLDDNNSKNLELKNKDFDIALIPFTKYKEIKNIEFQLAINTRSFGEMPTPIMTEYIKWIEENLSINGMLYNTNRYVFTKSKDKNKLRDYPYDNFWEVIISQPQWLQTHLHEFLLLRRKEEVKIPLSITLKSFPIETPPPGPIMDNIQSQREWLKAQGISN